MHRKAFPPPTPLPTAQHSSTELGAHTDDSDDSDDSDNDIDFGVDVGVAADILLHNDLLTDMPMAAHSLSPHFPGPDGASAVSPPSNTFFRASSGFLSSSSSSGNDSDTMLFAPPATTTTRPKRPPKSIVGSKTSFILGDKLGEGAHATVKEGIDERTLRIVAVKILDLHRLRRIRGGLDAIEREVSVQKRLKRHANLIELIDVIRQKPSKTKMYIILEMANGCTVQELVDAAPRKRLVESQVANFAYQTLCGLQYMHGKGVVHRDVKPSNLMLTANGVLKISDFGVAEFLDEYNSEDNVSRTSGSPAFQAPEIARGEHGYSGMKVDVWALGVTIYMLLCGRIPFEGETLIALFERIGEGKYTELDDVSEECAQVIRRMLTVCFKERVSVDELMKHPWVTRGAAQYSAAQRAEKGWIEIPKKDFGILDVVKRMYLSDEEIKNMENAQTKSIAVKKQNGDADRLSRDDDGNGCSLV